MKYRPEDFEFLPVILPGDSLRANWATHRLFCDIPSRDVEFEKLAREFKFTRPDTEGERALRNVASLAHVPIGIDYPFVVDPSLPDDVIEVRDSRGRVMASLVGFATS